MNNSVTKTQSQEPSSFAWIMAVGVLSGWGYWLVSLITGFIRVRILLSFLNETEAGIWFLLLNFLGYISLLDFGVGVTLARNISFALGGKYPLTWILTKDRQHFNKLHVVTSDLIESVASFYRIFLILGIVPIGGLGLFVFPKIIKQPLSLELLITWVLVLMAGGLAILTITPSATLLGQQKLHHQQVIAGITRIVGFVLTIVFLYAGWGIAGVAFAVMLEYLIRWILCWRSVIKLNPFLKTSIRGQAQPNLAKSLLGPSLRMGLITAASTFILQTDNLVISLHLGPEAVSPYAVIFQLAYTLLSVALIFPAPIVALSAKAFAEDDIERLKVLLANSLKYTLSFMLLGIGVLGFFSKEIISIWVGESYFIGNELVLLLLLAMFLEVHTTVHIRLIIATDQIPFAPLYIVAGILNLFISYWLAGIWGWHGAVLGTIISQGLTVYWYVPFFTQKSLNIKFREYVTWLLKPVGGLVLVILIGGYATFWFLSYSPMRVESSFLRLVIGSVCMMIFGTSWFSLQTMSSHERQTIFALLIRTQLIVKLRQALHFLKPS